MPEQVDLNQLRRTILDNQDRDVNLPVRQADKIFVNQDGDVVMGNQVNPSETRKLAEVNQGTFYSDLVRNLSERLTISQKLPSNTRSVTNGNVSGYAYSIRCALKYPYTFFVYFDGTMYQVLLVSPNLEGQFGAHDGHLYSDGRLCLSEQGGMPTLESAYAKSVIWAAGFSYVRLGYTFPFSNNN